MMLKQNKLKLTSLCVFVLITTLFLITLFILFKGFNGTDDLRYALLSSKFLDGSYSPFNRYDIFSGRILLISWQALIYKLFGINAFTTQIGNLFITVVTCYLTIFHVVRPDNKTLLSVVTTAFYFNPVTCNSTFGIMPDAYVMFACVILLLLLKHIVHEDLSERTRYLYGLLIAVVIIFSLFIKEIAILFLPWVCIFLLIRVKHGGRLLSLFVFLVFLSGIAIVGFVYVAHTGEWTFKISQIKNSEPIAYGAKPFPSFSYLFWLNLLTAGFYPVVFGLGILLTRIFKKNNFRLIDSYTDTAFIWLLIISYCFQLSFASNNPLNPEARQFLYLLPVAILFLLPYIRNILIGHVGGPVLLLSFMLMVICMLNTGDKWQWMIYTLIFLLLVAKYSIKGLAPDFLSISFIFVLWLSVLEPLYLSKPDWFKNLDQLDKMINSKSYYFPEHDNMANWSLLHQFDVRKGRTYNLDTNIKYYTSNQYDLGLNENSFTPGWFIVDEGYSIRPKSFFSRMDSLKQSDYFSKYIRQGCIQAYYIDHFSQIRFIGNSIANENHHKP